MNVEKYLRIINGIPNDKELRPSMVQMTGFIDIVPTIDIPIFGHSADEIDIESGNIIIRRTYFTKEKGDVPTQKITPLSDDISLHCGKHENVENLLGKTLEALLYVKHRNQDIEQKSDDSLLKR